MSLDLPFNINNQTNQPLDATTVVQTYADLLAYNKLVLYNYKLVAVQNDPDPTNNGVWQCIDWINADSSDAWQKVGADVGDFSAIFITNVTPVTAGKNVQLNMMASPNDGAVASILTDDTEVRVFVEWERGSDYKGAPTVNGVSVDLNIQKDGDTYTGEVIVDISDGATELNAVIGSSTFVTGIAADTPPTILTASFGSLPGSQTSLKQGDNIVLTIQADMEVNQIEIEDYQLSVARAEQVTPVDIGGGNYEVSITITAANRSITTQTPQAIRCSVRSLTGAKSAVFVTDPVNYNNAVPTLSVNSITYPGSQNALKGTEQATVAFTAVADSISFTSPNGELSEESLSGTELVVSRLSGSYNVSSNNGRFALSLDENGASAQVNFLVRIANAVPQLTSTSPVKVRSGAGAVNCNATFNQLVKITLAEIEAGGFYGTLGSSDLSSYKTSHILNVTAVNADIHSAVNRDIHLTIENEAGVSTIVNRPFYIQGFVNKVINADFATYGADDPPVIPIGTNVVNKGSIVISGDLEGFQGIVQSQTASPSAVNEYDIIDGPDGDGLLEFIQMPSKTELAAFGWQAGATITINIEEV